jgi:hypothetical protein
MPRHYYKEGGLPQVFRGIGSILTSIRKNKRRNVLLEREEKVLAEQEKVYSDREIVREERKRKRMREILRGDAFAKASKIIAGVYTPGTTASLSGEPVDVPPFFTIGQIEGEGPPQFSPSDAIRSLGQETRPETADINIPFIEKMAALREKRGLAQQKVEATRSSIARADIAGGKGTGEFLGKGGRLSLFQTLATGMGKAILEKSIPTRGKVFAPQVVPKYIPIGKNKFQLMILDEITGKLRPVVKKNGTSVVLSEKEVLIAEGKKAQSLIDPFETKLFGRLGLKTGDRLSEGDKQVFSAYKNKFIIAEGLKLLDSGIYTGSAANIKLTFDKWIKEVGINVGGKKASNTETFSALISFQIGEILSSGMLGAGVAISNNDLVFASRMAAGDITMNEESIRRILDINDKIADFKIAQHNALIGRTKKALRTKDYIQSFEGPPSKTPVINTEGLSEAGKKYLEEREK